MTEPSPQQAALDLLREFEGRFDVDDAPPVPVERIADSLLGLLIEEADDLRSVAGAPADQGPLSGFLDPQTKTIWIDAAEGRGNPSRRRFTIAHECGHWCLHVAGRASIWCRPGEIVVPEQAEEKLALRKREAQANAFAAELLMPETLVTSQSQLTGRNLALMAERFDVSLPAMRLRLLTLGLLPPWMARSPRSLT